MAERGDLTVLHEPFGNLKNYGETDVGGRTFGSAAEVLAWLRGEGHDRDVFFKETMDHQHDKVLADRPFLAEARHAFLIRRPEEIAASDDHQRDRDGAAVRDAGGYQRCWRESAYCH
jgi:hypothetical protein